MTTSYSSPWRHWPGSAAAGGHRLIHFKDIPDKLGETPYLGWLYILLVMGCAAAGAWLMSDRWRWGYALGSLISAGAIIFYVLTRSVGLPNAKDDIGNWAEPRRDLLAAVMEAAFIMVALSAGRREPSIP